MSTADQIDAAASRGLGVISAATRRFVSEQGRICSAMAAVAADTPAGRLRADLEQRAQAADNPTPRLLLPAHLAHASPHSAGPGRVAETPDPAPGDTSGGSKPHPTGQNA